MVDEAQEASPGPKVTGESSKIKIYRPSVKPDLATILGAVFAVGLIAVAISMGQSDANFFNGPSFMIVILGTMAATSISYTPQELKNAGSIITKSIMRKNYNCKALAQSLMDLATIARKKGVLALMQFESDFRKDPYLARAVQMVVDGYSSEEIERLLKHELTTLVQRHKRTASITRRASEVAPAMGLIGTLVGLVQMLAELENPEAIGPAMAVALLTTFYGAILGTVLMAPLSVKLEKNSTDESVVKTMIITACASMARQENPRRLEMLLNAELPPSEQISYFD